MRVGERGWVEEMDGRERKVAEEGNTKLKGVGGWVDHGVRRKDDEAGEGEGAREGGLTKLN